MPIEQWWPHLKAPARQWLLDHNGEPLPRWVSTEIASAAKSSPTAGTGDVELTDAEIDWIEATANRE